MDDRVFSQQETNKLIQILDEGSAIKADIESLNEGLKETVKAVALEMAIPPAALNKAITAVHKGNFEDHRDAFSILENILASTRKI